MMELLLLIFNFEFINLKLFSNFISIGEIIILIIFVNCFFTSLRIIISTLKKQKISYLIPLFDLFPLILICSNFIIFCKVNDQLWLNYQSLTGNILPQIQFNYSLFFSILFFNIFCNNFINNGCMSCNTNEI